MSDIGVLSRKEQERYLADILKDGPRRPEVIRRGLEELADIRAGMAIWAMWERGTVRLGLTEAGLLTMQHQDDAP